MSFPDDLRAARDESGVSWPFDFMRAWAEAESRRNDFEEKPLPGNDRGEVGWFQIDPREARQLGIDIDRVKSDPVYSVQSGAQVMDMYAAKIPSYFTGSAWWGLVKLWHGLPSLAKLAQEGLGSAGSWDEVYNWIQANVSASDIGGHDPMRRAEQVSRVLASAGELPEAGTVQGIGPITAIVLIALFLGAVGVVVIFA
jgi:hypothetical protein